ncbi:stage II sporulation protein D [Aquibacillus kalidii]|uniref:stage II sporulation protein D n=1 Tax=Aquibacillus kalidii TaxID=2762597 RepID=UPI001F1AE9D8|nr:stage II sporulation protein D [Aquibacillus kalidii]
MEKWKHKLPKNKWKQNQTSNKWRKPTLFIVLGLFSIILVIPTVIVLPYIQGGEAENKSVDVEAKAQEVVLQENDSPFSVSVYRSESKKVESVPLEEYVVRVVASEMPADFELEALKAQALAARTYVVNFLMAQENSAQPNEIPGDADLTDTVQHQVYKSDDELRQQWGTDYNWKVNKIKQAVAATMGEIVTYNDQPITPAFFSTSNGYTEDSENYWPNELPYLRSVASPWDEKISPKFLDQKILTVADVEKALGIDIKQDAATFKTTRTESNRVATITMGGKEISGRDVREKLNLRSTDFEVTQKKDHLVFTTKGYGHGVGMSQYGANGMAKEGKTYKDIVTYYYKGAEVSEINTTAPKLAARK